jgi:hypothetical protein
MVKHPNAQVPDASKMLDYEALPVFVDLDITEEFIKKVA